MIVTKVNVELCNTKNRQLKAIASVFLDREYVLNDCQIFEQPDGTCSIRFPLVRGSERSSRKFAFTPLSANARANIENAVLKKYQDVIAQSTEKSETNKFNT